MSYQACRNACPFCHCNGRRCRCSEFWLRPMTDFEHRQSYADSSVTCYIVDCYMYAGPKSVVQAFQSHTCTCWLCVIAFNSRFWKTLVVQWFRVQITNLSICAWVQNTDILFFISFSIQFRVKLEASLSPSTTFQPSITLHCIHDKGGEEQSHYERGDFLTITYFTPILHH